MSLSKGRVFAAAIACAAIIGAALAGVSCSFDYGQAGDSGKTKPDIVMENIEYVRVRGGDPQVRFLAEYGERWEDRRVMELKNFTFEQMEDHGGTVNAEGRAGAAVVQLGSGDISLSGGVRIRVDSEDVVIHTGGLEWKDKEKTLSGHANEEVDIERSDGTSFMGIGFRADARNRTWDFSGEVKGFYVEKDDDKDRGDEEHIPAAVPGPSAGGEPASAQPEPIMPATLPEPELPEPAPPEPEPQIIRESGPVLPWMMEEK